MINRVSYLFYFELQYLLFCLIYLVVCICDCNYFTNLLLNISKDLYKFGYSKRSCYCVILYCIEVLHLNVEDTQTVSIPLQSFILCKFLKTHVHHPSFS